MIRKQIINNITINLNIFHQHLETGKFTPMNHISSKTPRIAIAKFNINLSSPDINSDIESEYRHRLQCRFRDRLDEGQCILKSGTCTFINKLCDYLPFQNIIFSIV